MIQPDKKGPSRFTQSLRFPAMVIVVLWLIQALQMITGLGLGSWGVYPRHPYGIKGIFTSPFVHSADIMHLVNNSVPLFVSMAMIIFFYRRIAYKAIFLIYVLTGLGVWLFGRPVLHIGASGVVYGLVSFIFWNGVFRRNLKSIVLAMIILLLYSGMFLGVLPNQPGISWESHLIGGIVGILIAYTFRNNLEYDEVATVDYEMSSEEPADFFLDRDTFDRPKRGTSESNDGWFSDSTY